MIILPSIFIRICLHMDIYFMKRKQFSKKCHLFSLFNYSTNVLVDLVMKTAWLYNNNR